LRDVRGGAAHAVRGLLIGQERWPGWHGSSRACAELFRGGGQVGVEARACGGPQQRCAPTLTVPGPGCGRTGWASGVGCGSCSCSRCRAPTQHI
jgi:hypothetical protein